MVVIRAIDHGRRSFPPYGRYTYPVGTMGMKFADREIRQITMPTQIRPNGSRSPMAEAAILGRHKAILQGRGSSDDIVGI